MKPRELAQDLSAVGEGCIVLLRCVCAGVHEAVVLSSLCVKAKGCGRHHQHLIGRLPQPLLRACSPNQRRHADYAATTCQVRPQGERFCRPLRTQGTLITA